MRVVAEVDNLYASDMARRQMEGSEEVRTGWKEHLDAALTADPPHTFVTRRGKPVLVMVPVDWYRRAAEALGDPTEF